LYVFVALFQSLKLILIFICTAVWQRKNTACEWGCSWWTDWARTFFSVICSCPLRELTVN
jgi:hypothetical protein